ncbi:MAG TPA: thioredoxin [Thermoanaerobaculia bacterium]|nr:thioredoxin [Thermoanaerobaculia bacterium]
MPLPLEVGPITAERCLALIPEYAQRKEDYQPDEAVLQMLAASVQPADHIGVYLGTWCSDSQREVPKLLKILDLLESQYGISIPVSFVALDRSKEEPADLIEERNIEKVATFIYYRGGEELGRVVETPASLLEDDLLAIVVR